MKISSLRSGDDWQLEHVYLQEAGEDMPRVPEGVSTTRTFRMRILRRCWKKSKAAKPLRDWEEGWLGCRRKDRCPPLQCYSCYSSDFFFRMWIIVEWNCSTVATVARRVDDFSFLVVSVYVRIIVYICSREMEWS